MMQNVARIFTCSPFWGGGTGSRYYFYRNTSVREISFERQLWSNEDVCKTWMLVLFAIFGLSGGWELTQNLPEWRILARSWILVNVNFNIYLTYILIKSKKGRSQLQGCSKQEQVKLLYMYSVKIVSQCQ